MTIQHFSSGIAKVTIDGKIVLSSTLEEGERLLTDVGVVHETSEVSEEEAAETEAVKTEVTPDKVEETTLVGDITPPSDITSTITSTVTETKAGNASVTSAK